MTFVALGLIAGAFGDSILQPVFNVSYRRVGGLTFWRIGRIGGSFYIAKR